MQKPAHLFHASTNTEITVLEPRNEYPRYSGETPLVFATPHKALAAMFLCPSNIGVEIGVYDARYVIFINSTRAEYERVDLGGAIYSLPVDTFETDTVHGMGELEWYSTSPVSPLEKTVYKTSIEAMEKFNVEYCFVDDPTFQKIKHDPGRALQLV